MGKKEGIRGWTKEEASSSNGEHWADKIANKIIAGYPERDTFICGAGTTPSGTVHIGNFRDLITSEIVCRALEDKGYKKELILFWDDYDRFRKVPKGIPESFSQFIGMPLSIVPDPYNCHKSYAEHFEKEFEESLPNLGITPKFIYQAREYEKNNYYKYIKIALQKRKEIAEILSKFKTQGISEKDIENYFPFRVYCKQCKKDSTKIINYDGENKITYSCKCGQKETVDISKENVGKLSWKVDWAMRWSYYQICFEPGGKDHATPGGSYDISKRIAKEVFNTQPPLFQGYEFVGIRGLSSKMSGSSGIGISPGELLKIYEPELLRWLFARINPEKAFTFCFDSELTRQYDEFDEAIKLYFTRKLLPGKRRSLFFSKVDPEKEFLKERIPFRQVTSFGQIAQGNFNELKKILPRIGQKFNEENLKQRLENSQNWVKKFAKHLQIEVRDTPNADFYNKLNEEKKNQINKLREELDNHWTLEELTTLVYSIPREDTLSNSENKVRQRNFFKNVYQMLINSDTGPRLPTFLLALGKERVKKLLKIE